MTVENPIPKQSLRPVANSVMNQSEFLVINPCKLLKVWEKSCVQGTMIIIWFWFSSFEKPALDF